jgi:hypothetical protein
VRLSDLQVEALARIAGGGVEVRCEFFYGVSSQSARALERRELIAAKGVKVACDPARPDADSIGDALASS